MGLIRTVPNGLTGRLGNPTKLLISTYNVDVPVTVPLIIWQVREVKSVHSVLRTHLSRLKPYLRL